MQLSDTLLIDRSIGGDMQAYGLLIERYKRVAYSAAFHYLHDPELASDITQDVFLQVFKSLATLKDPAKFSSWLSMIIKNKCTNVHRERKRVMVSINESYDESGRERVVLQSEDKPVDEALIDDERRALVLKALDSLPDKYRFVITLRYFEELSYKDIADHLDVPISTVNGRICTAIKLLRKELARLNHKGGGVDGL